MQKGIVKTIPFCIFKHCISTLFLWVFYYPYIIFDSSEYTHPTSTATAFPTIIAATEIGTCIYNHVKTVNFFKTFYSTIFLPN